MYGALMLNRTLFIHNVLDLYNERAGVNELYERVMTYGLYMLYLLYMDIYIFQNNEYNM